MTTVHTQAELDKALAAGAEEIIIIKSPEGVWLRIDQSDSSHVVARGSSHVEARGSSHVEAWDSSHVVARGSSHVEAWDSSHVVAWDSSHVEAWGSSHVVAWDSSHVVARGSSHVEARGSSHVEAWDSSHVVARGSSHVEAWDSSHVEARGSSHVVAAKYVAVHLHSQSVTLSGGVVIDMTAVNAEDTSTWLDLTGAPVADGWVTVFKAVRADLHSANGPHPFPAYEPGAEITCPDWQDNHDCGHGLHFSPSIGAAWAHDTSAARFLRCEVRRDEVRCIDSSKLKAPSCRVVAEVDRWGKPVAS